MNRRHFLASAAAASTTALTASPCARAGQTPASLHVATNTRAVFAVLGGV